MSTSGEDGRELPAVLLLLRNTSFFFVYSLYLTLILGLGQRLFVWPWVIARPRARRHVVGRWLRLHARLTMALARVLGGVKVTIEGHLPAESLVVVMNHQSVLDIPLGLMLMKGPQALIPTRARYKYGVPGISPLTRLAGMPFVTQTQPTPRAEVRDLKNAVDCVARGECSMLIFPEGHRSTNGEIGPFMRAGLRLLLQSDRPVFAVVAVGLTSSRTFKSAFASLAGREIRVKILGPFAAPARREADAFIERLHAMMSETAAELRAVA